MGETVKQNHKKENAEQSSGATHKCSARPVGVHRRTAEWGCASKNKIRKEQGSKQRSSTHLFDKVN